MKNNTAKAGAVQVKLTREGQCLAQFEIAPKWHRRLLRFAKANSTDLPGMINKAIRYATSSENEQAWLWNPINEPACRNGVAV